MGAIQSVVFADWFLPLSAGVQVSSMTFHGLVAHFVLALKNILFS